MYVLRPVLTSVGGGGGKITKVQLLNRELYGRTQLLPVAANGLEPLDMEHQQGGEAKDGHLFHTRSPFLAPLTHDFILIIQQLLLSEGFKTVL